MPPRKPDVEERARRVGKEGEVLGVVRVSLSFS